jgi:hypothetical protein
LSIRRVQIIGLSTDAGWIWWPTRMSACTANGKHNSASHGDQMAGDTKKPAARQERRPAS